MIGVSVQAKAARIIRSKLRKLFPSVTFSIIASTYANGDSVAIRWTNGPSLENIRSLTTEFQSGSYCCITDSYILDNKNEYTPQVKFIKLYRSITEDVFQFAFEIAKDKFNGWDDYLDIDEWKKELSKYSQFGTPRGVLNILIKDIDLTNIENIKSIF